MTLEEFELLKIFPLQEWLVENEQEKPDQIALRKNLEPQLRRLLANQLKYWQRSKKKLPAYHQAGCILPGRAYEQASSEQAANLKDTTTGRVLDLTAGLGVDTLAFAKHGASVVALEANPVLASIGHYNLEKLGISNVNLLNQSAEAYLKSYTGRTFDLIYADPDRRDSSGKRQVLIDRLSPNLISLMPRLRELAPRLLFKLSPLFDPAEAIRIFPEISKLSVVSINREVKEVLVDIQFDEPGEFTQEAIVQLGEFQFRHSFPRKELLTISHWPDLDTHPTGYLFEPDPAYYRLRCLPQLFSTYYSDLNVTLNDSLGYGWGTNKPGAIPFPGQVYHIEAVCPYKPKSLKKMLKGKKIGIKQRNFPFTVQQIRKQLQVPDGSDHFLICTSQAKKNWAFLCKQAVKYFD
ncbi:MAG: class I SAM-dependent methyltransferase [Bacteroidota bacterium]